MCASQGGQCYHSGIVFANSSNRGKCMKPCRWPYTLYDIGEDRDVTSGMHFLARKDMCMIDHVPLLCEKGAASMKIEGRMKDADYLGRIVALYREVIDLYYANPLVFQTPQRVKEEIELLKVRDYSTCFALNKAGIDSMGLSGAREPGQFSRAMKEPRLVTDDEVHVPAMNAYSILQQEPLCLTVHVSTLETLERVLDYCPSWVYIDTGLPVSYWNAKRMVHAFELAEKKGVPAALTVPPVTTDDDMKRLEHFLDTSAGRMPSGFLAGNLGAISMLRHRGRDNIFADYHLNAINEMAISLLKNVGVDRACHSIEFPLSMDITDMECEALVHGPMPFMQFESCAIFNILGRDSDCCQSLCSERRYGLRDQAGEVHEIVPYSGCRNYFMSAAHLCMLNDLDSVFQKGVKYIRIDARLYDAEFSALLLELYSGVLQGGVVKPEDLQLIIDKSPYPLSKGPCARRELIAGRG